MYHCKYLSREPNEDGIKDTTPKTGAGGKSVKLKTNCFRIVFDTGEFLHRYVYELPEGASQEKEIMFFEQAWSGIKAQLEHFVIRCPGYIFSPTMVGDFTVKLPSGEEMKIKYVSKLPTEQLNLGKLGPSAVVGQHVASKLAEPFKNQKLGKRYYNNCPQAAKGVLACLSGFSVASVTNACSSGVLLQLDAVHRPLGLKSVTDALYEACQALESDVWAYRRDPAVADEWERYCVDSTVVTQYNSRVYRIKAVHFDKSPHDEFSMFVRDRKEYTKISFLKYFEAFYQIGPAHPTQPLLEAYPEKVGETVYLLPELCVPTGVTDEMRKEKNVMTEAMKNMKASPQDRLAAIKAHATEMRQDARPTNPTKPWKCNVEAEPVEVRARVLDPLQVVFQEKKVYPVEDGNFTKLLRNGLQCAVKLDDWSLMYPSSDESVLDIWLRSLKDIAQVAFGIALSDPKRIMMNNLLEELPEKIANHVNERTQLVLLLIPVKDSPKAYNLFKQLMLTQLPCVTQVVRSETIRKRQSIAAVLSKVVLQINAKFCGPLWNVVPRNPDTDPVNEVFRKVPFSIMGIDVHRNKAGEWTLGVTATLDRAYSQYFSMSALLGKEEWHIKCVQSVQNLFRDALLCFASANRGVLPQHIVVYRGSVSEAELELITAEKLAMQETLELLLRSTGIRSEDRPKLCFIAVARRGNMRFFLTGDDGKQKNPETGTVMDDLRICPAAYPSFYLISQAIAKGTASPTFYSVLLNEGSLGVDMIQSLTYRLCLMYFNSSAAVRLPAPVLYAAKLARMIGGVVKQAPHPSLQRSLFYL